jgi:hypothetical protein
MKVSLLCLVLLLSFVGQAHSSEGIKQESSLTTEDYFYSPNKKEQEVLQVWKRYFERWGYKKPPVKRIKDLRKYAKWLVYWTTFYERNEGNFGGKLLLFADNHILIAVMMYKETGLQPNVVGDLGEVGLLQVWGDALDGYRRQEVKSNPELGIRLGIQWLAYSTTRCKQPKSRPYDWRWALTQYGAGPKAGSKNNCKVYRFARQRIWLAKKHRKRINKKQNDLQGKSG